MVKESKNKIIDINSVRMMKDLYDLDYQKNKGDDEYVLKEHFIKFSYSLTTNILDSKDSSKINDELFVNHAISLIPSEILDELIKQNCSLHNILNDLNIISKIEKLVGFTPLIFSPMTSEANHSGWLTIFKIGNLTFSSPELDSENKSRLFSLLIFIQLKQFMLS